MKWKERVVLLLLSAVTLLLVVRIRGITKSKISYPLIEVNKDDVIVDKEKPYHYLSELTVENEDDGILQKWSSMHPWDIWQEMVSERCITQ